MDQFTIENSDGNVQLLPAINDDYGGVVVEMKEHMESDVYLKLLKTSMSHWTLQGKKGVWIKLPTRLANLVETTLKEGFWYHHAEPDYLMLVKWIPKTTSTIPLNASHCVGVGAIVLNDKREMLVVQEKNGRLGGTGVWKIPTGILEVGEDVCEGAIREVKEETGIDTEFVEVLAFRQLHKVHFGKSDLFFVCMMRPLSFDIQIQELEIEAAQVSSLWFLPFAYIILSISVFDYLEFLGSGGTTRGWWNDRRIWLYKRTSSYLFALLDTILGSDLSFVISSKVTENDLCERYEKEIMEFGGSSPLLTMVTTVSMVNLVCFLGFVTKLVSIDTGTLRAYYETMIVHMVICVSFVVLNVPLYLALFVRRDKGKIPSFVTVRSVSLSLFICTLFYFM
ncbi:hypothetical protein OSB04_003979 [Centaurea solstitialis]|uniref:Nudix hydrolase domain-containing protein n=1 Tax=Centaurea solstitialis TaxID=347529 RepID=A0AA38UD94_9ASTR|nr:hypothetical protein OSB04_003979 [Centaurea solstitialis]